MLPREIPDRIDVAFADSHPQGWLWRNHFGSALERLRTPPLPS